jgi:hypothetical protein
MSEKLSGAGSQSENYLFLRISQMEEIVFQLRVVADTPKLFSTTSLG